MLPATARQSECSSASGAASEAPFCRTGARGCAGSARRALDVPAALGPGGRLQAHHDRCGRGPRGTGACGHASSRGLRWVAADDAQVDRLRARRTQHWTHHGAPAARAAALTCSAGGHVADPSREEAVPPGGLPLMGAAALVAPRTAVEESSEQRFGNGAPQLIGDEGRRVAGEMAIACGDKIAGAAVADQYAASAAATRRPCRDCSRCIAGIEDRHAAPVRPCRLPRFLARRPPGRGWGRRVAGFEVDALQQAWLSAFGDTGDPDGGMTASGMVTCAVSRMTGCRTLAADVPEQGEPSPSAGARSLNHEVEALHAETVAARDAVRRWRRGSWWPAGASSEQAQQVGVSQMTTSRRVPARRRGRAFRRRAHPPAVTGTGEFSLRFDLGEKGANELALQRGVRASRVPALSTL